MSRALLVANPSASGFTGGRYRAVSSALRRAYDLETVWPESPEASRKAAAAAAESGLDVVFAMGGDGVVHHVAAGLVGSVTALGIIPAGTTNVLSRILGIPQKPQDAAELLSTAPGSPLATARFEWSGPDGNHTRHALFSLGLGLDADVVDKAEQRPYAKVRFGALHYARTTVSTVVNDYRHRPPSISVRGGDVRADAVALMVQIHHAYTYVGRMPLRLGSADAALVGLAVSELDVRNALSIVGSSAVRRRVTTPGSHLFEGVPVLEGVADPTVAAQADGEGLGTVAEFRVTYVPDELIVLTPGQESRSRWPMSSAS